MFCNMYTHISEKTKAATLSLTMPQTSKPDIADFPDFDDIDNLMNQIHTTTTKTFKAKKLLKHLKITEEIDQEFDAHMKTREGQTTQTKTKSNKAKVIEELDRELNEHLKSREFNTKTNSAILNEKDDDDDDFMEPYKDVSDNFHNKTLSEIRKREIDELVRIMEPGSNDVNRLLAERVELDYAYLKRVYSFAANIECPKQSEQRLTFDQLLPIILHSKIGYEVFRYNVLPFYDYETIHENPQDTHFNIRSRELKMAYSLVEKQYPGGKILCLDASGMSGDKYKVSFHFIIRGCGYYACGSDIPRIQANGFDQSVYKGINSRQLFRLPYCSKDGKTRFLKRVTREGVPVELEALESSLGESVEQYLVSNVKGEKLNIVEEVFDPSKLAPEDKKFKFDNMWSHEKVADLLDCFGAKQDLTWDEWINVVWAVVGGCSRIQMPYRELIHSFSRKSCKYNEELTSYTINRSKTTGNTKGFGSLLQFVKSKCPEAFTRWVIKHPQSSTMSRKDPYIWGDFRREFENRVFESQQQMNNAVSKQLGRVVAYVSAGEGHYYKKDNTGDMMYSKVIKFNKTGNDFTMSYKLPKLAESDDSDDEGVKRRGKKRIQKETQVVYISQFIKDRAPRYDYIAANQLDPRPNVLHRSMETFADKLENYDESKIRPFIDYVEQIIANGDEESATFIWDWLAFILQHPNRKVGVALALIGPQGVGKSMFAEMLGKWVFGEHLYDYYNTGMAGVLQHFNSRLAHRKWVCIDELREKTHKIMADFEQMKSMITQPQFQLTHKGVDSGSCFGTHAFIFLSNNVNCLHLESTDRRYAVFETTSQIRDADYWEKWEKTNMNKETGDILYSWLMDRDIRHIKNMEKHIPGTRIREVLKQKSKPKVELFLEEYYKQKVEDRLESMEPAPGLDKMKMIMEIGYELDRKPIFAPTDIDHKVDIGERENLDEEANKTLEYEYKKLKKEQRELCFVFEERKQLYTLFKEWHEENYPSGKAYMTGKINFCETVSKYYETKKSNGIVYFVFPIKVRIS